LVGEHAFVERAGGGKIEREVPRFRLLQSLIFRHARRQSLRRYSRPLADDIRPILTGCYERKRVVLQ
jgi:hypothetical protein